MENFDDMYNSQPDGSEKGSEWTSPSTSTFSLTTVAEIVPTDDIYDKNNSKISKIDLKRRAVLNFDSESVYSTTSDCAEPSPTPGSSRMAEIFPPLPPLPPNPDFELTADEIEAKRAKLAKIGDEKTPDSKPGTTQSRKIYVSGMPPSITEKPLFDYFSRFGPVKGVNVVRDKWTGISRGFGFVSFMCEADAETALNTNQHILEGRPVRVKPALESATDNHYTYDARRAERDRWLEAVKLPTDQTRIYVGPLDDDVSGTDLQQQFVQFGPIQGASRLRGSKKNYGFIDFRDAKSVLRAFGSKTFIKGKHVKVALSRLAIDVLLSNTVVYFYDAHIHVDEVSLEKYFSQYGQVFRTIHLAESLPSKAGKNMDPANLLNKNYGFVDFVKPSSAKECAQVRSQLIPPAPGQFVRLREHLPTVLLHDFLSMSERDAAKILQKLEKSVPEEGAWGSCHPAVQKNVSQVRVPATLISRLIGERGKTISEICRDSKTKISIPKVKPEEKSVVIQINGSPEDIKIAQYLMQKILKGGR